MRIAYFVNQYPAVSHTFVRREIRALESLGVTVCRFALRPGNNLVDEADKTEKGQTHYIVGSPIVRIARDCVATLIARPAQTFHAVGQAFKIAWRSDRGVLRHLAYLAEAAVLARWCRRYTVQHIHAHFGTNSAAIAMLASRFSGIPYSFTAHGPDEFERAPWLSLEVKLDHATFVACVSSYGRSQFMRWTRSDLWRKIEIVHCGLDDSFFSTPLRPPPLRPRLICVGRLSEQKAQLVLVAAVRRLRDAGIYCKIVLVGDGPMRHQIEEAISGAGLQNEITITGWASGDRIKTEIANARALVLPSFAENMPVVIMEAFAIGRPVISTYVAGIPELVQPGQSGWLVPAGDEVALAGAIREALDASVEQLATIGAVGRAHVVEHHDCIKEAMKLKALFEQQLHTSNSAKHAENAKLG